MRTQRTPRRLPLGVPILLAPLYLGACAAPLPQVPAHKPWLGAVAASRYDFAWRLSGQRDLAPLQVFDDGQDTWLQFPPQQTLPAIFVADRHGERLAAYDTAGPYLRVQGVWPALVFRGGNRQARAQYAGTARAGLGKEQALLETATADVSTVVESVAAPLVAGSSSRQAPVSQAAAEALLPAAAHGVREAGTTAGELGQAGYAASTRDGNMRRVLGQWASRAGWTFDPWHWDVDMDVPLAGNAEFGNDFVQAVRQLLAATELSGQPLQPCFYSNRVLRVVAWTQACDRHSSQGGGAA